MDRHGIKYLAKQRAKPVEEGCDFDRILTLI